MSIDLSLSLPSLAQNKIGGQLGVPSIASLWANGEQGWWYDYNDFSAMWQDSAGTTPVTAVGQPVGRIADKSGRGNFRIQATAAARPILRQDATTGYYYLEGSNSRYMYSATTIDFTATDEVTLSVGFRNLSDVAPQCMVALSSAALSNAGCFCLFPSGAGGGNNQLQFNSKGTGSQNGGYNVGFPAPTTAVATGQGDISAPFARLRRNGVLSQQQTANQGTGNYGNYVVYFGSYSTTQYNFNGYDYGSICVNRILTANELTAVERQIGRYAGVSI